MAGASCQSLSDILQNDHAIQAEEPALLAGFQLRLREAQSFPYELQHGQETFKPTPPNFNTSIVKLKQSKGLWAYLEQKSKYHSGENT